MILAFKPQFVQPILDDTKIHTIRLDKHDRWEAGRLIQMATGVRTPNYNCFKESKCISTQEIYMNIVGSDLHIIIGSKVLSQSETIELAINDGFETYQDFHDWFYPIVNDSYYGSLDFKIIHWTGKRY